MRHLSLSLGLALLLSACSRTPAPTPATTSPATAASPATATPATSTTYGRVTEGPTLTPAQVLAGLDEYDGKAVRVAGTVADVCQNRGCWLDVAGAGGETIRLKVKDGEIVFPTSVKGKKVIAEGVVVKIPADPADDKASCGGEEEHEDGDGDCARPTGARARLDGTGAVISDAT